MTSSFRDKRVLIAGGAGGIGLEAARAFGSEGAYVVVADIAADRSAAALREIRESGAQAEFIVADLADEADVTRLFDDIAAAGGLDIAVNCVGIDLPSIPFEDTSVADFDRVMAINARALFLCMRHELRMMKARGAGAIVNVASQTSHVGWPGQTSYCASKHAVIGLTQVAALEAIGHGVRVNAVSPGPVNTELFRKFHEADPDRMAAMFASIPIGRPVEPLEVARAILFLGSPDGAQLIGQTLHLNGGTTGVRP